MSEKIGQKIVLSGGGLTVLSALPSRRNSVLLAEDENGRRVIIKRYLQNSLKTERTLLRELLAKGVPVPEIIGGHEDFLVLEYIEGVNFCELLEKCEEVHDISGWKSAVSALSAWFLSFYPAFSSPTLRDDINLRNFILSGGTVFGVDFESAPPGEPESDIGRMAAFILCYDPAFSPFKKFAASELTAVFEQSLRLSPEKINNAFRLELEAIKIRRGLDIPPEIFKFQIGEK